MADGLGLYLHIPFCQAICSYCNFNRGLLDAPLKARYVDALAREIETVDLPEAGGRARGRRADTIFFGGGTPSLLESDDVARLLSACRASYDIPDDAEITLETNPETATEQRLAAFRDAGVNRISFGVQSFDDDELRRLGRIHSAQRAREAIDDARRAGFGNVSLDLMFWLPGQTMASWMRTIGEAIMLESDHLSLYLLELYPNAPLKEAIARQTAMDGAGAGAWQLAADDLAADMYLQALERLDAAGFVQYEISNVSRPGWHSRHNVKYWQGGDWIGFGCGAHSTVAGVRWKNVASTMDYIDRVTASRSAAIDRHRLSAQERVEEALFTGLRLTSGIDAGNFERRFGVEPWSRYGDDLAPFVDAGYLWKDGRRIGLTRTGMLVANEILATFV
jgi:oxygen-independent coproporphyrinogen-3 oxidase